MKQILDQTFIWGIMLGLNVSRVPKAIEKLTSPSASNDVSSWISLSLIVGIAALASFLFLKNRKRISSLETTIENLEEKTQPRISKVPF